MSGRLYRPRTVHLAPLGERGPVYSYRGLACPEPCCAVVVQRLADGDRVAAMRRHLAVVHGDAPAQSGESKPGHQQ